MLNSTWPALTVLKNNRHMDKEFLCKCNNCGNIMYDENPQVDAVKKDIIEYAGDIISPMEMLNNDGETFWGCGDCQTDAYLIDL